MASPWGRYFLGTRPLTNLGRNRDALSYSVALDIYQESEEYWGEQVLTVFAPPFLGGPDAHVEKLEGYSNQPRVSRPSFYILSRLSI